MFLVIWILVLIQSPIISGNTVLDADGVRLADGIGPYGGRVEISINGVWGTICDSSFDMNEAIVLCRMMNLSATTYFTGARFGEGIGPIFADRLTCYGNQRHIRECSFVTNTLCTHSRDVSIICTECGRLNVYNGEISSVSANGNVLTTSCNSGLISNVSTVECTKSGAWSVGSIACKDPGYPLPISDIRLSNGVGLYDGRIEVLVNDTWGTVCGSSFGAADARAVCHILGYSTNFVNYYRSSNPYGQGSGPIYIDKLDCSGSESRINNCTYNVNNFCSHSNDAAVACNKTPLNITNIRLVNGTGLYDGRVELFVDGFWGTICGRSINSYAFETLCRMKGSKLKVFKYYTTSTAQYGEGSGPILVSHLACGSGINDTNQCSYQSPRREYCTHAYDVSLVCSRCDKDDILHVRSISFVNDTNYVAACNSGFSPQSIHLRCLSNGSWEYKESCTSIIYDYPLAIRNVRLSSGDRVEINVDGVWGTICNNNFDLLDAEVICRMLGLNFQSLRTGCAGSGPIFLDNLRCNGTESHINNCEYNVTNECSHGNDSCVACTGYPLDVSTIRLSRGRFHGRIELEVDKVWGTVCDDSFDTNDANVICRMLGYMNGGIQLSSAHYGEGSGPIYVDDLSCIGNESHINECKYITEDNCGHGEDASVICRDYPLSISDVRLSSGDRVEVNVGDVWGTICNNNFNSSGARVICSMLGLDFQSLRTGCPGSGPIFLDNLRCNGTESHINNCEYNVTNECSHGNDICVACTEYLDISTIRLSRGLYHGRIELEVDKVWGTVCDDSFGKNDANVICRMLGYQNGGIQLSDAYYGAGSGPIYVDDLSCIGTESHINECKFTTKGNCGHTEDVSVICKVDMNITDARLVNGTGLYDGRAEVNVNGTWGTICGTNFDKTRADSFCDMIGMRSTQFYTDATYGQGNGPVYDIYCRGTDISTCLYLRTDKCSHNKDVSVVCSECGMPDISIWGADYFTYHGKTLYADCSYYKSYVGSLSMMCDNATNEWTTEGECQEYTYPLNITGVRLSDGNRSSRGRIEIQSVGFWGTICDDSFGMAEANVLCSMVGYPRAVSVMGNAHYGQGKGPIFVDDLECEDNATHINHCMYATYDNCQHSDDVAVICTDCGDPKPAHGLVNSSDTSFDAMVQVQCEQDYRLNGSSVIHCLETNNWSDYPTCTLIDCGDPCPLNGAKNSSKTTNGTVVEISCYEGYNLSGNAVITCQQDNTWTDYPTCKIIDCGWPDPPNADVDVYNNVTTFGAIAVISCITGYQPGGKTPVTCITNGSWEAWPQCEIIDCGDPTPNRGNRNDTNTTFATVVEITCDAGLEISGNSTLICQADGTWSDNPVCDSSVIHISSRAGI